MRVVLQRVLEASVKVDDKCIGSISQGIVALVGFNDTDNEKTMSYALDKILNLRIFEDEEGKMNLSLIDLNLGLLIIPNFTLYGDCRKGRRPSFSTAAKVEDARNLYEKFINMSKEAYSIIETGEFQADMKVLLINDGPVTLLIDTD